MASPSKFSHVIRFGVFEANLEARELRKSGTRFKVHDQSFEILAALLERPGEIVSREELRQRLWPTETFVGFDHSINTSINKLREALSDSADSPRYIETVPRRGYRFIAPLATQRIAGVALEGHHPCRYWPGDGARARAGLAR